MALDLFGNPLPPRKRRRDRSRYLRRIDMATLNSILTTVSTTSQWNIPVVQPNHYTETPTRFMSFAEIKSIEDLSDVCCHFYVDDWRFVRVFDYPDDMIPILRNCMYVICPDFSQLIGWPRFACFSNSCWNKAIGAYWQMNGVNIVPNITWNYPDSYKYSVTGWPKGGMIAINSKGCLDTDESVYYWEQGYNFVLNEINPNKILRCGPIMPNEDISRSVFFSTNYIDRIRNGR